MTNSDWWSRAHIPPRPQTIETRTRELLASLRKGEHAVTLEKRPVYGVVDACGGVMQIGEELIFSVNGHWRRMRVFMSRDDLLNLAVAETVAKLECEGG